MVRSNDFTHGKRELKLFSDVNIVVQILF